MTPPWQLDIRIYSKYHSGRINVKNEMYNFIIIVISSIINTVSVW